MSDSERDDPIEPTDEPTDEPAGAGAEDAGPTDGQQTTDETADETPDETAADPRPRRSRLRRAAVVIAVLCLALGFGLAVQVRQNAGADGLSSARQEDLVDILDELGNREERLRTEIGDLQDTQDELASGEDKAQAAQAEAEQRSARLAILAGTVGAKGPGVRITIADVKHQLPPEVLLDAIQELRAAGAEAIQVGPVRIGVSSAVTGSAGTISIDKKQLTAPYVLLAIGDPQTMSAALKIPGGVVASVELAGGQATVEEPAEVVITALRQPDKPDYAQPTK